MHHLKLSAYNSNVQRIKNRYKKVLKNSNILDTLAYNSNVQRIKKNKKILKSMHHFKLSAYNKV